MIRRLIFLFLLLVAGYLYLEYLIKTKKLDKFLDRHPNSRLGERFEYLLGKYYLLAGKPELAMYRFKRIIKNYSDSPIKEKSHYNLALTYEEMGNMRDAIMEYKKFIERYEDSPLSSVVREKLRFFQIQK